ncbi:MAG: hypothetical protein RIN56_09660 [Sporomusaceae bacterium]|nr:hypothetical protein [Sporomusaceae bacterium]
MVSARMIRGLCLALVLTVTFLMSPAAVMAAPASGNLRPAVESDPMTKCVDSAGVNENFEFVAAEPGEPAPEGLYRDHDRDRDRHHRQRCERVRHNCMEQCRHHRGHHDNRHHCIERCMRNHDCHNYR